MQGKTYFDKHLFQPIKIEADSNPDVGMIIVIPCFNEPDIASTLESLFQCEKTEYETEVIIVINAPEDAPIEVLKRNEATFNQIDGFVKMNKPDFHVFVLREETLPGKVSGVGLARKIGMDEASFRFERAGRKDGIITCLDADCLVAHNYLRAIETHYETHPDTKATSIYFEHPLGSTTDMNWGMINYELHLRYYIQALRFSNYPFAYHTIGSSMTVTSYVYQQQGGMNKRKAGEDFYFLHKLMPLGGFFEINHTAVYPSPRISDRVPFGTGKAMGDWHWNQAKIFNTYNPKTFGVLREFLLGIDHVFQKTEKEIDNFTDSLPEAIRNFLDKHDFQAKILEINHNTTTISTFRDRIFRWLNGLMVLKFVHYSRDYFFDNLPVEVAAAQLLKIQRIKYGFTNNKDLLDTYRILDSKGWKHPSTS